jgi:hypothetical protein
MPLTRAGGEANACDRKALFLLFELDVGVSVDRFGRVARLL